MDLRTAFSTLRLGVVQAMGASSGQSSETKLFWVLKIGLRSQTASLDIVHGLSGGLGQHGHS